MKYEVRQADPADGGKLLELIESEAAKGDLELIYTRRPNPVYSYHKESRSVSYGVIKDQHDEPAFMEVCISRSYYINGNETPFTYVCGVRKKNSDTNHAHCLRTALEYERRDKTAAYCSILDANENAVNIFCRKPRAFFPEFSALCGYSTFLINPRALCARIDTAYSFGAIGHDDLDMVCRFLESEGKKYEMFPVVRDLEEQFSGLRLSDCFALRKHGELAAFGALWDQRHYRQYIVKHYGGIYKYLRKAARIFEKSGYIYLPPEGQTANVLTLTLLTAKCSDKTVYRELLSHLAREAIKRNCPIVVAGMSKNNCYYPLYKKLRSVSFDSTIYLMKTRENKTKLPDPNREVHLECGYL